jgi:uncharacterized membrane protein
METTDKELLTQVRRLFSEHGMKAVKEQVDRIAQEEYEYLRTLFESETKVKKVKEVKEVKEVKKVKSDDEVKEEVPVENTVVEAPAAEPIDPNQKVLHIQSQKKHVAEPPVQVEKSSVPSYIFKAHGKKKA